MQTIDIRSLPYLQATGGDGSPATSRWCDRTDLSVGQVARVYGRWVVIERLTERADHTTIQFGVASDGGHIILNVYDSLDVPYQRHGETRQSGQSHAQLRRNPD